MLDILFKRPKVIGNLGADLGKIYDAFPKDIYANYLDHSGLDKIMAALGEYELSRGLITQSWSGKKGKIMRPTNLPIVYMVALPTENTLNYLEQEPNEGRTMEIDAGVGFGCKMLPAGSNVKLRVPEKKFKVERICSNVVDHGSVIPVANFHS
jgi:hypothetical protein